ncbi:MAG: DUF1592 domain-containing protein [Chitinophagaceae bacterium]|nr:DUF1592 domain-containing protein [Oligoflexus sp.]
MKKLTSLLLFSLVAGCGSGPAHPKFGVRNGAGGEGNSTPMDSSNSTGSTAAGGTTGAGSINAGLPTNPTSTTDYYASNLYLTPTVTPMRRLLNREYLASVKDILGIETSAYANRLVADGGGSFDNNILQQSLDSKRLQGYVDVSMKVADAFFAATQQATTQMGCAPATASVDCMTNFIKKIGRLAYRRDLDPTELAALVKVYTPDRPLDGMESVIASLFASSNFLFVTETGVADANKPGYAKLKGAELATKLSLLLLGKVPSADLLALAEKGSLDTPAGLEAQAHTILASPEAKAYQRNFVRNWLSLDNVAQIVANGTGVSDSFKSVAPDLPEETYRLFDDFMKPGSKFMDVYTAPYTYMTTNVASIYKTTVTNPWQRVDLTPLPRRGFLSQPAVLASLGDHAYNSIFRGQFLALRILCQDLGGLPPGTPMIDTSKASGTSERAILSTLTANAACAACHKKMEPLGLGLERYDGFGVYRTADSKSNALTGAGNFTGTNPFTFTDEPGLATQLHDRDDAKVCVVKKLTEYLLGRAPAMKGDETTMLAMQTSLLNKDYVETLVTFIKSDSFTYRKKD